MFMVLDGLLPPRNNEKQVPNGINNLQPLSQE